MATLAHLATEQTISLRPRHLVGRSTRCDLRLADHRVSGEHAVVVWDGAWQIRDLGSRNRTFIDGRPLARGAIESLRLHSHVAFGTDDDPWVLVDDAPPGPGARTPDGRQVRGQGLTLGLPSDEEPRVLVIHDGRTWVLDGPTGRRIVSDGESVQVDDAIFVLSLPEWLAQTEAQISLADCGLRFSVSGDEEHVEVTLVQPDGRTPLGSRAHHFLLLHLARLRLDDRAAGHAETGAGWAYQDELAQRLGLTDNAMYLHIHRARTQLAQLGLVDAADIIERRPAARQIRIGLVDLVVDRI
ncbi:MAG: FHA domain-containing protein [Myxococcota bacterium]